MWPNGRQKIRLAGLFMSEVHVALVAEIQQKQSIVQWRGPTPHLAIVRLRRLHHCLEVRSGFGPRQSGQERLP